MTGRGCLLFGGALLVLLALQGVHAINVEHVFMCGMMFCQKDASPSGQFSFDWDREEVFDVDLDKKETEFRIPDVKKNTYFEPQGALQNMAVCKQNLDVLIKAWKGESGPTVEPKSVNVYPEDPVELGKPNILICNIDEFFPPVLNVTWKKNGNPVYDGVYITSFYPREDANYRRFAYLQFIPGEGDVYSCSVEHPGLQVPTVKFWVPEVPSPPSETAETVVCGLGLAVGIIGIIAGTILVIKGMKKSDTHRRGIR